MTRLGSAFLLFALLSPPAWAQSPTLIGPTSPQTTERPETVGRDFAIGETQWAESEQGIRIGGEIGPNATAGLGMFGIKRIKDHQAPVTVRDFRTPKSRRAGMGITLKF